MTKKHLCSIQQQKSSNLTCSLGFSLTKGMSCYGMVMNLLSSCPSTTKPTEEIGDSNMPASSNLACPSSIIASKCDSSATTSD